MQDHTGYMWFGTNNGLNRYDGNCMVKYFNETENLNSLKASVIHCIYEDSKSNLWVGTWGGGLSLYNREQDNFITYMHESGNERSLGNNDIWSIYEDSNGNLWICTQKGLDRFDYETQTFEKHLDDLDITVESADLRHSAFTSITEGPDGFLWISLLRNGVLMYDPEARKLCRHLKHEEGNSNSLSTNEIVKLYTDREGNVWFCSHIGALERVYVRQGNITIEKYFKGNDSYSLSDDRINFITQDSRGKMWIGTEYGLNILNKSTGRIDKYFYNAEDDYSLSGNHLFTAFISRNGIIWIGTSDAGISIYDPWKWRFSKGFSFINNAIEHNKKSVKSIYMDSDARLWIGTDYGLNKINTIGELEVVYSSNSVSSGLGRGGVSGLVQDWNKNLWVGTWGDGLHKYDSKKDRFIKYDHLGLKDPNIRTMEQDYSGNILMGTTFGYFVFFNPRDETFFEYLCLDADSLKGSAVVSISPDRDGSVWIGMYENGGILRLNPDTREAKRFYKNNQPNKSLSSNNVLSLLNDDDHIWIGTKNGLNRLNKKNGRVEVWNEKDGLPARAILCIEKDKSGFLWLSTITGLTKYNPQSGEIFNYNYEDGVLENCIVSFKDRNNEYYFGGMNGIFNFNPAEIQSNPYTPPVILSNLYIFNSVILPGQNNSPLKKHINETEAFTLKHHHSSFSIAFSSLNYTLPQKNKYRYKLQGFDSEWVNAGTRNRAYYSNLKPGRYTFMVQGSNNDGLWNKESKVVNIRVLPAPWATWWAYSFYFILILSLILLLRFFIVSRQNLKSQLFLEKIQHEKDFELSKKSRELQEMKLQFYTNISHEFRTPLTLILGPMEKILNSAKGSEIESSIVLVQRNAQRLLRLINQILDLSMIEADFMKLRLIKDDVVKFIATVVEAFNLKAERLNIDYTFKYERSKAIVYFDDDKLEKIIYNLLSNAFKYTPNGGRIEAGISFETEADQYNNKGDEEKIKYLIFSVRDSGKGILHDEKNRIFDYFYRSDKKRSSGSSGLGLSLVNELIRIMQGTIELKDTGDQPGSWFEFRIPVFKDAFESVEIIEKNNEFDEVMNDILLTETPAQTQDRKIFSGDDLKRKNLPLVLVVEDNQDMREYISKSLSHFYRILEAADGKEGFRLAVEEIPDLIVSDIMMPDVDGVALNRMIKNNEKTSHVPVILLTAKSSMESRIEGIKTGADDYIVKPFEMEYLVNRIENLIKGRVKLREAFSKKLDINPSEIAANSLDSKFLEKMIKLVEDNIEDPDFGVNEITSAIGMSRAQLYRKLKSLTQQSVNDFIQKIRLNRAAKHILEGNKTVAEITYLVGFKDPSYFTKCFRKQFECLPSEFSFKYQEMI